MISQTDENRTQEMINNLYKQIKKEIDTEQNLKLMAILIYKKEHIDLFMSLFPYVDYEVIDKYIKIMPKNWNIHKEIIMNLFEV